MTVPSGMADIGIALPGIGSMDLWDAMTVSPTFSAPGARM